jgi:hypothetical protein
LPGKKQLTKEGVWKNNGKASRSDRANFFKESNINEKFNAHAGFGMQYK